VIIFRDKGNASFAIIRDINSEAAGFNREAEDKRAEPFINLCAGKKTMFTVLPARCHFQKSSSGQL